MSSPRNRAARVTTVVVASAVAVVVAGTAFGFASAGAVGEDVPTESATPSPATSATADPTASTAPTPQPTTTAPLQSEAPVASGLTAEIVSSKAVQAKATQPGQVGGPAVSFVIRLTNTTGSAIDLSNTVVNASYGEDQEPAYQLDSDGLVFPTSVAGHRSVTGTAVFTIPTDERGRVTVTVDTSTSTPVIAFTGAAPK